ncbi:MAG: hypothetical protein JRG71_11810 [Deltaproteobacteria bacterium]|nr:hypothetical protein [Deltaproteobacteria bacterium]
MRRSLKGLIVCVLLCVTTVVSAASWPQVENRLQQWQGAKEIALPQGVDPFEDELFAPVAEAALMQGYMVLPDGVSTTTGLVFSIRDTSRGKMLVLKRGEDGAILAMEKMLPVESAAVLSTTTIAKPLASTPMVPAPAVVPPVPTQPAQTIQSVSLATSPVSVSPVMTATSSTLSVRHPAQPVAQAELMFELGGAPVQIVAWPLGDGAIDLYVMYDDYIQRLRSHGQQLQLLDRFTPPVSPTRALRLDIGDMDGDRHPELAAVWAEDIRGVSDGTNSKIHSWVLSLTDNGLQAISDDLSGYVSLTGQQARLQKRSEFSAFTPEVYALDLNDGVVVVSDEPVRNDTRLLFNQLEWPDDQSALVWNDDDRLMLVAKSQNTRISGSTLLTDFGRYQGPMVSIPLQDPEYRSGFSAGDRIMAREVVLGRRLIQQQGSVFTLVRGRSEGLPLVGRPSGVDRLVKIDRVANGLSAGYPFAAVEAFMIDFSVYGQGSLEAIVLLNEKADGSGRSYLRMQTQR